MIVGGAYFVGDDNTALAWQQHDVYDQALGIIVSTCNRYAAFAKAILGDTGHNDLGSIVSFDHRVLQLGHDLLAAAWRFREDPPQARLRFEEAEHCCTVDSWLDWLRDEVTSWSDQPRMVRSVLLILANENQPIGYLNESRWCLEILGRFSDVPWEARRRAAIEEELANDMEKVERAAAAANTEE